MIWFFAAAWLVCIVLVFIALDRGRTEKDIEMEWHLKHIERMNEENKHEPKK